MKLVMIAVRIGGLDRVSQYAAGVASSEMESRLSFYWLGRVLFCGSGNAPDLSTQIRTIRSYSMIYPRQGNRSGAGFGGIMMKEGRQGNLSGVGFGGS